MASPTTSVLDAFTGTAALSASWTKIGGASGASSVSGVWTPTGYSEYWWNASTFSNAGFIEAYATVAARPTANASNSETYLTIANAWSTGADTRTGYQAILRFNTSADQVIVQPDTAGSLGAAVITVNLGTRMAAGDKWMVRHNPATGALDVSTFQSGSWTTQGSTTVTTNITSAPNIGLGSFDTNNSIRLDDFGGGVLVGGGGGATVVALPAAGIGDIVNPAVSAGDVITAVPAAGVGDVPQTTGAFSSEVLPPPAAGVGGIPAPVVTGNGSSADATVVAVPGAGIGAVVAPAVAASSTVTPPPDAGIGDVVAPGVSPAPVAVDVVQCVGDWSGVRAPQIPSVTLHH